MYILGTKPGRKPLNAPLNERSEDICKRIAYILRYYDLPPQPIVDRSNIKFIRFHVGVGEKVTWYLNEDEEGTVDLTVDGIGLIYDLSPKAALLTTMEQLAE